MLGQLVGPEIVEMITNRQFGELRATLEALPPDAVADILADMSVEHVGVVFRVLPRDFAAAIFEYMPLPAQEALLHSLGQEQVAAVLNAMAPDDRTALLEELPGAVTQRLLALLSPDERRVATQLLGYPEESVGRRMTPDYVAARADWTVAQLLEHIRKVGRDKETLSHAYVVDERGRLIDDLRLREIVLADPAARLSDLMDRQFFALRADQDQEEAVREFQRLDRIALPVVDSTGLLVGIVTVDDVLDVAQQEATEDIQKMGAVEVLDAPYLETDLLTMARKRGLWLSGLFLGEMLTATAMGHFEGELARAQKLALFVPLIISSGGNSGSQASTLVIRAMALGEVKLRDWWRVLRRELASGLLLGLWLALLGLARVHAWQWLGWQTYTEYYHRIALTVAAALLGVILWGTLVGGMLPLLLRRLKIDPATLSAPLVATLVDVSGLVIYFEVGMLILRGTLL